MPNEDKAAWDQAKSQAPLPEDIPTVPIRPTTAATSDLHSAPTVPFPQGFQPASPSYWQDPLPPVGGSSNYPDLPQTLYQGNAVPPLPPGEPPKPVRWHDHRNSADHWPECLPALASLDRQTFPGSSGHSLYTRSSLYLRCQSCCYHPGHDPSSYARERNLRGLLLNPIPLGYSHPDRAGYAPHP